MYSIIYDSKNFIVIHKKPGFSFHSESESEGLCSEIRKTEGLAELYPVHRLDKETSGLLLFAKTKATAKDLARLFRNREIDKYYIALSDKKPKKRQGLIVGDMEKSRRGTWKLLRSKKNPAKTRFFSKACGNGCRLFIIRLLTGKTHQIRVALKSISAPVAGDPLYNKESSKNFDRCYLHASALRFSLNGETYQFTCLPEEGSLFQDEAFNEAISEYKQPWGLDWPGS